jgi:uncharacterized protein (TIGR02145 family)
MKTKPLIFTFMVIFLAFGCSKDKGTSATQNNENTTIPSNGIIFNSQLTYGTVTDIDGNAYKTIIIGTQTWMAENLKVTRYRNGDSLLNVTNNTAWYNLATGAYCDYDNTPSNSTTYGKLYNWHAVNDPRNICPAGWHAPNEAEWETLGVYLGGYQIIGGKMKETGITHWVISNDGATNESGFTGLPGGMRYFDGPFIDIHHSGYWWSSSKANDYYDLEAHYYFLSGAGDNNFLDGYGNKTNGMSVRCLKD